MSQVSTRAQQPISVDPFPPMERFHQRNKLPTYKDVIGVMRNLTSQSHPPNKAAMEVAKRVYSKWYHDSIFCHSMSTIKRRVEGVWQIYYIHRKRARETGGAADKFRELKDKADMLFDMYTEDKIRQQVCEEKEFGVKMSDQEFKYLEDMRGERKMECNNGVDPVWFTAVMRRQRRLEWERKARLEMETRFNMKSLEEIEASLIEEGMVLSNSDTSVDTPVKTAGSTRARVHVEQEQRKTVKRLYFPGDENNNDPLPPDYRCLRDSERKVKDKVYTTVAALVGIGLSVSEAGKAIVEVGKGMFDRKEWKEIGDNSETFDDNTMPANKNVRDKLRLIEAQSLALIGEEIIQQKERGGTITHTIDSTTRKLVGTFATQGVQVGQESPFPLPLMGIHGESTQDIAQQVDFGFEVLAKIRGVETSEIYKQVDVHMTDSVEHNKGIAKVLQELYDLDKPAGQLFCGSHTTLGFASALNKVVASIERDMKMENILAHFMVEIEAESKHGSFAGQALDMMLKLVAPEYSHKQWNKFKEFTEFLRLNKVDMVLFSYKDQRFGCLSRAAAVLLYNMEWLNLFLQENPAINNRLACLVRDLLELPYLKAILVVFAAFGVHLIEPFYCRTIQKGATHSKLGTFYKAIYTSMNTTVSSDFFSFSSPQFEGVGQDLFKGVKKSYGEDVLVAVMNIAREYEEEVVSLANLCLPELRTVLARQRRDYGISEEFPPQYPVEQQAANIDQAPVHNLDAERRFGVVDYRLKKLQSLEATSRSLILQRAKDLREGRETRVFRTFKKEAAAKREVELAWSEKMKEKIKQGYSEKQVVGQTKERKRLDMLEALKEAGGPFTDAAAVQAYLDLENVEMNAKKKQSRLKLELRFARESSTTLPQADPIFRIQVTLPSKKRRDKTASEFGESLMVFLGKKSDKSVIEYTKFKESLEKFSVSV